MIPPQLTRKLVESSSKPTDTKPKIADISRLFNETPEDVLNCLKLFKKEFDLKHTDKRELLKLLAFGKRIDNSNTNLGGSLNIQYVKFLKVAMADLEKRINASGIPRPRVKKVPPPTE